VPDENSFRAAQAALDLVLDLTEEEVSLPTYMPHDLSG